MQVVLSSTLTNEQKDFRRNLSLGAALSGTGLILLLLPLTGLLPQSALREGWGFWIPAPLGLVMLGFGGWYGWRGWLYLEVQNSQERLSQYLSQFLDDEFIYFRNLNLPGTRSVGAIDGVLLGPHGAIVMKVEQSRGEFACEGDTWYRYSSNKTKKSINDLEKNRRRLDDSPSWTAIRAGREVKAWLSVRELPLVPVRPVVVLSKGKIRSLKRPSCTVVEIWSIQNLIESNLLQVSPQDLEVISGGTVEQIAQRLQA